MIGELRTAARIAARETFDFSDWGKCAVAALYSAVGASGSISDPSDDHYINVLAHVIASNDGVIDYRFLPSALHNCIQGIADAQRITPQDATLYAFDTAMHVYARQREYECAAV
jgi:hypothetical protein